MSLPHNRCGKTMEKLIFSDNDWFYKKTMYRWAIKRYPAVRIGDWEMELSMTEVLVLNDETSLLLKVNWGRKEEMKLFSTFTWKKVDYFEACATKSTTYTVTSVWAHKKRIRDSQLRYNEVAVDDIRGLHDLDIGSKQLMVQIGKPRSPEWDGVYSYRNGSFPRDGLCEKRTT